MIYYVCKYTPLELFRGFGESCAVLEAMPENFDLWGRGYIGPIPMPDCTRKPVRLRKVRDSSCPGGKG